MEDELAANSMEVEEAQIEARDGDRGEEEARNPSRDSVSSSSSSDSDSDEEAADEAQIQTLESQLKENPWNYDAHVQYIQSLRKLCEVERLRKARESMKEYFPLTPKMWQEWTKDEALLNSSSEAFTDIEKLYECGVHEYLSVPMWCDYLNFVQERDQLVSKCAPAGVQKMRNLFETALTSAGLHVVEGSKIWEAYREYEQAIFLTLSDDDNEGKLKQVGRIRSLFHRQLSIPLVDLESALASYKLWEVEQGNTSDVKCELEGLPANVISTYRKAGEMYNTRSMYEERLSKSDASDTDKLQSFISYIKFEEAAGDPARVQILYERAVSELPLFSELWLRYTSYLDNTLKVPNIIKDVYSRAVRNCPSVGNLWVGYMLSLERLGASEEELSTVFERSIQCAFQSFEEYLDLFLTRVDGLRRRMSVGVKGNGLSYSLIRDTFQRAADYFSQEMIRTDDLLHLYAYWARLEVTLGEDIEAARAVWETLIKKSGSILEVWQGYIAMEVGLGHINEARSIYKRCYSKRFVGAGSEEICHSWLRFEREHGTLEDFDLTTKKVTHRLQELEIFKGQQEAKNGSIISAKENIMDTTNVSKKRKVSKSSSDKQHPPKRQKETAPKLVEDASDADSLKNSQSTQEAGFPNKGEETKSPTAMETDAIKAHSTGDSKLKESKPNFYPDQCTAYVSNISLEAKEEHLREFFAACGGVTAIRLLKDKFTGKPRGIAYVDFSDEEHLAAAIAMNKQKLLGQKLSIARSDPAQSRKRATTGSNSARGRGRGAPFRNDRGGPSKSSIGSEKHESEVKLVGRNTFAAPRAVRALGWTDTKGKDVDGSEQPKSNNEFRAMLFKK